LASGGQSGLGPQLLTFRSPAALQVQLIDVSPDVYLISSTPEMIVQKQASLD
jgi:hypothetical protein